MQEPNPPRTAKEAALLGAQADKPPFNREADRRHVIASVIRRAGEFTGQNDEATDEVRPGAATSDTSGHRQTFGNLDEGPVDSSRVRDLSLADLVLADQATLQDFAAPPITPDEAGPPPPLGSSMDALQSRSWMIGGFDEQADAFGSQPAFTEPGGFIDANTSPDIASGSPRISTPDAFPSLESFPFDISALRRINAPMDSKSPPDLSNLFFQSDTADSGGITPLPDNPADEPPCSAIQWSSSGSSAADALPAGEDRAPITYLPFGQPASASNAADAPDGKLATEVTSNYVDIDKDVAIAMQRFESLMLKALERAGEQDRIDALHREASRRACL
jgi:hypothetical protein